MASKASWQLGRDKESFSVDLFWIFLGMDYQVAINKPYWPRLLFYICFHTFHILSCVLCFFQRNGSRLVTLWVIFWELVKPEGLDFLQTHYLLATMNKILDFKLWFWLLGIESSHNCDIIHRIYDYTSKFVIGTLAKIKNRNLLLITLKNPSNDKLVGFFSSFSVHSSTSVIFWSSFPVFFFLAVLTENK